MNTFKRTSVCAAVLAGLGAVGAVGTAEAVYVNPDGTGQALLYPYYSVRGAKGSATAFYDTLFTVVNTTTQVKAIKVRFLEGRRSMEVLDFNMFMSPNDAWIGAVSRTANGARLISGDKSCISFGTLFANTGNVTDQSTPNVFKNYAYSAGAQGNPYSGVDGADQSLDRAREGHFEIIEMGIVTDANTVTSLTHNSAGTPANCAVIQAQSAGNTLSAVLAAPNGGLFGGATLINVLAGTDYSYDAVALEQVSGAQQYAPHGYPTPNLLTGTGGNAKISTVLYKAAVTGNPTVLTETWATAFGAFAPPPLYAAPNVLPVDLGSIQAVSAVLMHDTILNEYVTDSSTASATDWIVTFPTKGLMVSAGVAGAMTTFTPPFGQGFVNNGAGSCEPITMTLGDREEQFVVQTTGVSPQPIGQTSSLCWETNVITFGSGSQIALGSLTGTLLGTTAGTPYQAGWAAINLASATAMAGASGRQNLFNIGNHRGLPVIGFSMQDFSGGVGAVSNYGGGYKHKTTTLIN